MAGGGNTPRRIKTSGCARQVNANVCLWSTPASGQAIEQLVDCLRSYSRRASREIATMVHHNHGHLTADQSEIWSRRSCSGRQATAGAGRRLALDRPQSREPPIEGPDQPIQLAQFGFQFADLKPCSRYAT